MSGSTLNAVPFRSTIFYTAAGTPAALGTVFTVGANGIQSTTNALGLQSLIASTMTASTVSFSTMTASTILTQASTITLAQNVNVPNRFVEIGCDLANSMYFDFHSSDGALPDYSTRIISQGGATTGTGGLNMYASTIGLVATNGVGIGTTAPTAILSVLEAPVNGDVSRKNMFLGLRNATGGVQNAVSMALALGPNVNTTQPYGSLDIKLNGLPVAGNTFGAIPDVTVMSIIGNGNVGIGTTVPSAALHIKNATTAMRITGNLTNASTRPAITTTPGAFEIRGSGATDGSDDGFLRLSAGGGSGTSIQSWIDISGYSTVADMGSNIVFGAGTERMRITAAGNVGIGTTNPQASFQLGAGFTTDLGTGLKTQYNQVTSITAASVRNGSDWSYGGTYGGTGPYTWTTNIATGSYFTIATGITAGATYQVSITASGTTGAVFSFGSFSATLTTTLTTYTGLAQNLTSNGLYVFIYGASGTVFTFSNITFQRLDTLATGNVGIGTTTPAGALDVIGSSSISNPAYFYLRNNGGGQTGSSDTVFAQLQIGGTYGPWIRATQIKNAYTDSIRLDLCTNNASNDTTVVPRISVMPLSGYVGIGTASPAIKFQVVNTGYAADAGYVKAGIHLYTTYTTGTPVVSFRLGWYDDTWDIGGVRSGNTAFSSIRFFYNGTYKFQVDTAGNISAPGTKGFDIQHPLHPTDTYKRLYHVAIEGPRADLIYRGVTVLVNGFATVNIDKECTYLPESSMTQGTFWALCVNPQVFLQNNDSFDRVIGKIDSGVITITCENSSSNAKINWMVIAERRDENVKISGHTTDDGFLITEYTTPH